MNVCLFLGAGFSAEFGLPTMDRFLGFLDGCTRVERTEKEFVGKLILEARNANSFLESSPTNLEDILSFAVMGDRLGLEETPRLPRILDVLRRVFSDPCNVRSFETRHQFAKELLTRWIPDERHIPRDLKIITTNYDINVECSLRTLHLKTDPGFEVPFDSRQSDDQLYSQRGGVGVFKLHGSANWYEEENGAIGLEGRYKQEGIFDENRMPVSVVEIPLVCSPEWPNSMGGKRPLIIPPSFLKPDLPPTIGRIWSGAAKALQEAHVLVFVGYSFPRSDTEMMYFLARALLSNSNLRRIEIIDTNAEEILRRLTEPTSKYGSHFRGFLKAVHVPNSWTEAGPSGPIS